jgi:catechol 2,3-dioxygenase-like lactoylglutathione lyase family enzyme
MSGFLSDPRIDGRLYHLGVATRDLDRAMAAWGTLLGVRAWHRIGTNYPARHRDWEGTIAQRNAFGRWGDVIVELVEVGQGNGPVREFLSTRGEGLFHVGYATDDPTQRPGGVEPCFEVRTPQPDGAPGIVYLDTIDTLGFFLELVPTPLAERVIAMVDALDDAP